MRRSLKLPERILAIDPTHRGFGYVVLEEPNRLVDWGVCEARTNKTKATLSKVGELIHIFSPDVLVVEDVAHLKCQRRDRARLLIEAIVFAAHELGVRVCCIPTVTVREHYEEYGATNKDAVARLIVQQFPELEPLLPPRRRTWMPESTKMAVFDAVAFALTCIERHSGRRPSRDPGGPRPEREVPSLRGQAA